MSGAIKTCSGGQARSRSLLPLTLEGHILPKDSVLAAFTSHDESTPEGESINRSMKHEVSLNSNWLFARIKADTYDLSVSSDLQVGFDILVTLVHWIRSHSKLIHTISPTSKEKVSFLKKWKREKEEVLINGRFILNPHVKQTKEKEEGSK